MVYKLAKWTNDFEAGRSGRTILKQADHDIDLCWWSQCSFFFLVGQLIHMELKLADHTMYI